jgi:hypothetical protein
MDNPLVLALTVGLVVSLVANVITIWILPPRLRIEPGGWVERRHKDHDGVLYKFRFKLGVRFRIRRYFGTVAPGDCAIRIEWKPKGSAPRQALAKWDETPNPFRDGKFAPDMVPSSYYQPLFLDREYSVPILMREKDEPNEDKWTIFSAQWFGATVAFSNPRVYPTDPVTLRIMGSGLVTDIKVDWDAVRRAKADSTNKSERPSLFGE